MYITSNFEDWEFFCRHCGADGIVREFVEKLQVFRETLGRRVHVISGYRCSKHPLSLKTPGSPHIRGVAADLIVFGLTVRELYRIAAALNLFHGFGVNDRGRTLHLDVAERVARWCYDDSGCTVPWTEA